MKIIVAHPLAATELGCDLDATVDIDDDRAASLIADGFARRPVKKSRSATPTAPTGADTEGA